MEGYFWFVPAAALTALTVANSFFNFIKSKEDGNETMMNIAKKICDGAIAYLKQQFKVVAPTVVVLSLTLFVAAYIYKVQNNWVWAAFLSGAGFSYLCGYIGMKASTKAAPKVVQAARKNLGGAFQIALRGGAIMGLVVSGFALFDISAWYLILYHFIDDGAAKMLTVTTTMLTFGAGASLQANFARLGGGIYTKSADIGSDMVGKVFHHFNEDDARNPATIADNVGDNVGDVAGMGADLYESYTGSIISAMVLGTAAGASLTIADQIELAMLPTLISALGIIASIIGIYMAKIMDGDSVKKLVRTMNNSVIASSLIVVLGTIAITEMLGLSINLAYCIIVGIAIGVIIGEITNYYTSSAFKPTKTIAESAMVSDGMVVISGLAIGMKSTFISIITIAAGIGISYYLASEAAGGSIIYGLYGISIASVGMLSTLPITLATDAYGPIADNAGGCAEMAHLPAEVRERTDKLDSVGNVTAAIGKGFAIGSAALTAMALLASYVEELRIHMIRIGMDTIVIANQTIATASASLNELMTYFHVDLSNSNLIIGLELGGMLIFVFAGLCLEATHKVARVLVREIERQLSDPDIESGKKEPDSGKCIAIITKGAQKQMIAPALLGIITPIIVGQIFGVAGVMGLMAGELATGVPMAIFMSNAGGAWDNAKKKIESGEYGGKGSLAHKAAITGDVVGDPCKDTAGPSINIFIKLSFLVSIVSVGLVI